MQKVLRRTALAEAQATRRALKRSQKDKASQLGRTLRQEHIAFRASLDDATRARKNRREDYDLGPLAPKRDVGDAAETYGAMDPRRLEGYTKREEERVDVQPIVSGDRVVVTEGRDRGRIGEVISVNKKKNECTVKGLNLVDVVVPEWVRTGENNPSPVRSIEKAIPLPDVWLVHKLTDPETGHARDVVVRKLILRDVWHDNHLNIHRRDRIIPGLDVKVPWPKKPPKEQSEHDVDTLRMDVELKTWIPTLLAPPMPATVIDELRNKYSKFRDRHDEAYVAKKVAEDEAAKARKKRLGQAASTPLQEAKRKERREKKALGYGDLSEQILAKIGEVMAKNKQPLPRPRRLRPSS